MQKYHVVSQEHPMGCAVACVASLCNLPYGEALHLFRYPENAWARGFYCYEVVEALSRHGLDRIFAKFDPVLHIENLFKVGIIVFIEPNERYPMGHYLIRMNDGWMNPWANFPQMIPVKSDIEENLPGVVSYVIY